MFWLLPLFFFLDDFYFEKLWQFRLNLSYAIFSWIAFSKLGNPIITTVILSKDFLIIDYFIIFSIATDVKLWMVLQFIFNDCQANYIASSFDILSKIPSPEEILIFK